jgi:amino acid transporter
VSLLLTTIVYALVTLAAVRAVPLSALKVSESPLALVWSTARGGDGAFLSAIAVFAALNGVLAQIVMASRVLFGLGKRSGALAVFHHAHPRFGTPVLATLLLGVAVVLGALYVPFATLAETTSSILLGVFVLVNLALILQKRRERSAPFRVPMAVPVAGFVMSLGALAVALAGLA